MCLPCNREYKRRCKIDRRQETFNRCTEASIELKMKLILIGFLVALPQVSSQQFFAVPKN